MDDRLLVLQLVLDAMDVSSDIATVSDRKRVQKAIYLSQISGPDLGYRFGWYKMGPYSSALARDYYHLKDAHRTNPDLPKDAKLRPDLAEILATKTALFTPPSDMEQSDWLEALASVHYLDKVRGFNSDEIQATFANEKPQLAHLIDRSSKALSDHNLA